MAKSNQDSSDSLAKTICTNRRARFEYEITDTAECGIVLTGSEVKSLRAGKVVLEEAFAKVQGHELWLINCDIATYPQANLMNHEPRRERKLLMRRREISKFAEQAGHKGLTLVPLSMYFTRGIVKVKIGIGRGKKLHDKRESLKNESARREIAREMSNRR